MLRNAQMSSSVNHVLFMLGYTSCPPVKRHLICLLDWKHVSNIQPVWIQELGASQELRGEKPALLHTRGLKEWASSTFLLSLRCFRTRWIICTSSFCLLLQHETQVPLKPLQPPSLSPSNPHKYSTVHECQSLWSQLRPSYSILPQGYKRRKLCAWDQSIYQC